MKIVKILAICIVLAAVSGCGQKGGGTDVSPEMKDFMSGFGSSKQVDVQIKKFGKEGLDTKDMEMYDLKKPSVIKTKAQGASQCYDMSVEAGMTTRYYTICWEAGKISSVTDHQFKKPE